MKNEDKVANNQRYCSDDSECEVYNGTQENMCECVPTFSLTCKGRCRDTGKDAYFNELKNVCIINPMF